VAWIDGANRAQQSLGMIGHVQLIMFRYRNVIEHFIYRIAYSKQYECSAARME